MNRVGAILDHVTQFRPEADFVKLCEALEATNQEHVVRQYLTKDALETPDHGSVAAVDLSRAVSTKYSLEENMVDTWRTVLMENRSALIDVLDSSDEFVNSLVKYGVMNFATGELCRVSLGAFIKPPLATARAASYNGRVHLFVCLFVCLSVCLSASVVLLYK